MNVACSVNGADRSQRTGCGQVDTPCRRRARSAGLRVPEMLALGATRCPRARRPVRTGNGGRRRAGEDRVPDVWRPTGALARAAQSRAEGFGLGTGAPAGGEVRTRRLI